MVRLIPRDEKFFDLFTKTGEIILDASRRLEAMLSSYDRLQERVSEIQALEKQGDGVDREVSARLERSFVTPFDREDIHALTEEIDDVVDDLFAAASLLQLSPDDERPPELGELADVLVAMTDEMVSLLETLQTKKGARHRLGRIEHLERQGDAVYRRTLGRLFSGEYEAIDVIRWKDTAQSLEAAINAIEDVGDVVEIGRAHV